MTRLIIVTLILSCIAAPGFATDPGSLDLLYMRSDQVTPQITGDAARQQMSLREARKLAEELRRKSERLAAGEKMKKDEAPFAVLLREARYTVSVDGEAARVRAQLDLRTAGEFPHDFFLELGEVALESARLNDGPATVLHGGRSGAFRLRLPPEGEHRIELVFLVGLHQSRNVTSLQFNVPRVPRSRIEAMLPGTDLDVDLLPAASTEVTAKGTQTKVTGLLKYGGTVYLRWIARNERAEQVGEQEKEDAAERKEPIVFDVTALHRWQISGVKATGSVALDLFVKSGEMSSARILLPDDLEVLDVSAPHLAAWDVREGPKARTLELHLKRQAKGRVRVTLSLCRLLRRFDPERKGATGTAFDIPSTVTEIEDGKKGSEKGHVLVEILDEVEVLPGTASELTAVDPSELPGGRRNLRPGSLAFKFIVPRWTHELRLLRHEELATPTTQIVSASWDALLDGQGLCAVLGRLQVKNNERQYLRLLLPDGARFGGAVVDGKAVVSGEGGKGTAVEVLVPLARSKGVAPKLQAFEVQVAYLVPQPVRFGLMGKVEMTLPRLDLPVDRITWTVQSPSQVLLSQAGGDLRQLRDSRGVLQNLFQASSTVLRSAAEIGLAVVASPFMFTFSRARQRADFAQMKEVQAATSRGPGRGRRPPSPRRSRQRSYEAKRRASVGRAGGLREASKKDAFMDGEDEAEELMAEGGERDDMDLDGPVAEPASDYGTGAGVPAPAEKTPPRRQALLDLMSRSQSLQGAVPVEPKLDPQLCRSTAFCRELAPGGDSTPALKVRFTYVNGKLIGGVNLLILLASLILFFALPIRRRLMGRMPALLLFLLLLGLMATLAHYFGNGYRAFWEGLGLGCALRIMRWTARRIMGL